jgi:hypothetical protein
MDILAAYRDLGSFRAAAVLRRCCAHLLVLSARARSDRTHDWKRT